MLPLYFESENHPQVISKKTNFDGLKKTWPDTRHKMRLVGVFFTFENNTGQTDGRTDGPADGHDLL